LVHLAGSQHIGDTVFNQIMHPLSRLLVQQCDAVLRIGGTSVGADEMVAIATALGRPIYYRIDEITQLGIASQEVEVVSHDEALNAHSTVTDVLADERVIIQQQQVLANDWGKLNKITFAYQRWDGRWETATRETYDRGNGATILLMNREQQTVLLTRQFRLPAYVNGHDGFLIEACAGLLDADNAEDAIKRETEEEIGYRITAPQKIFEAFMSPGSVTERLTFFIADYSPQMRLHNGGGVVGEDIEVLELPLATALQMISDGEIVDGKTIMLLQFAQLHLH